MEIRIGSTVFTDWKIVREIGRGASGIVYEIRKESQGAALTAALKVLRIPEEPGVVSALRSDGLDERSATNYLQKIVDDLVEEIKIMISLKAFAHVVKCEDFSVEKSPDGSQWTVAIRMELLEPISEYRRTHDLTEADVHRLALQLTRALVLLEERNIIHRDIKPENIFINSYGDFKIGDFGIARVCDQTSAYLSQKGTQSYMAPEVFHGQEYDHTVDIYSLGLVLYKYLNRNRLPFLPTEGAFSPIDRQSALAERLSGKKELPAPVCASAEFSRIILKMCACRPEDRYSNAKLLLRDLEAMRPSGEVVLAADDPDVQRERPPRAVEENLTSGPASRPGRKLAEAEGAALLAGSGLSQSQGAPSEPPRTGEAPAAGEGAPRETSSGGTADRNPRKGREYAPQGAQAADAAGGGKKKGPRKAILLAATLLAIVLAALVPAYLSQEFALVVESGSGSGSYKAGTVVAIEADSIVGMTFERWEAEGAELAAGEEAKPELALTMPRRKVQLRAVYSETEHALQVASGSGSGQYHYAAEVTAIADDPAPGYAFTGWKLQRGSIDAGDLSARELAFAMPDEDVALEAQYAPLTFQLRVDGAGGSGNYTFGSEVLLKAEDQEHASFTGWVVDEGELSLSEEELRSAELCFDMPAGDLRLRAVYKRNEHRATIRGGTGSGTYAVDDRVEIAAEAPASGMAFSRWRSLKGKPTLEDSSLPETSFPMPDQEVELEAQYAPLSYKLMVDDAYGSGTYEFGTDILLSAEEQSGEHFVGWKVVKGPLKLEEGAESLPEIEFSMPAGDVRIAAVYAKNSHVATIQAGSGSGTYEVGETVEIAADPAEAGMRFRGWTVIKGRPSLENAALEATSFPMPDQDVVVACEYEPIEYKLVVNNGSGGGNYHLGDQVTISAEPEKNGMRFDGWTVDEGSLGFSDASAQNLTFRMPAEDLVVSAHYAAQKQVLKVKNGKGSGMYTVGEEVVATAEAYGIEGLTFAYWTVDEGDLAGVYTGEIDLTQPTLRFPMPDSALTITANYALPQVSSGYVLSVNGGSGSGEYEAGERVRAEAAAPNEGLNFVYWMVNGYPGDLDVKSPVLEFEMPEHDVTLTAFFSN